MLGELYKLLTKKTDEVLQIKNVKLSNKYGGKRIVLLRITRGKFPNIIKKKEEIIWNPFKVCVEKSLYNYRELGRKSKSLTNIFAVLKKDIKDKDVFTNINNIRFERIIPCGSKEYNEIVSLVKKYYIN